MPIIVNAVLNEHQLVLDIVAFVGFGDFPRSRLGEKQRGKILGNWVSRKMRTIAQFSIRDPEAEGSVDTVVPEGLARRGSGQSSKIRAGSVQQGGSSLRHVESLTNMPVAEEMEGEAMMEEHQHSELPGYPERGESRNDLTPTNERAQPLLSTTLDYSPVRSRGYDGDEYNDRQDGQYIEYQYHDPADDEASPDEDDDYSKYADGRRESQMSVPYMGDHPSWHDGGSSAGGGGGLRVANRTSTNDGDDWERDVLGSMNIRR